MAQASQALSAPGQASVLMPPPPPRVPKRKQEAVLDEDEWTSKLEQIIERDFFPELSKLQSKVEWLQAIRSGDPQQIRQAQLNIAARRARSAQTPGSQPLFTPSGTAARLVSGLTPFLPGASVRGGPSARGNAAAGAPAGDAAAAGPPADAPPDMSLDAFLAAHTSEDNASFGQILEDVNKRRRLRQAARAVHQNPQLLALGAPPAAGAAAGGDGERPTDGYGTSGQQPDQIVTWRHRPLNTLYYDSSNRDVVPYTERELSDMVQGPPKQILHRNTRFPKPEQPATSAAPTPDIHGGGGAAAAAGEQQQQQQQQQQQGGGGGRPTAVGVGGTAGYDILATPSFDPELDGTPFMTWGDIEATPLRIEADDLPPGPLVDGGAKYRVPDMPAREAHGHALAAKAATSLRRRGGTMRGHTPVVTGAAAAAAAARRGATPAGLGGAVRPPSGAQPGAGAAPMSEAAKRLAASLGKGKKAGADSQLRASYKQTPGAGRSGRPSTGAGSAWTSAAPTPSRGWTPAGTPSVHATMEEEQLRVQALLKLKEKEAKDRAELDAARAAALASLKGKQAGGSSSGGDGGSSKPPDNGGTGQGSLTDGLLAI